MPNLTIKTPHFPGALLVSVIELNLCIGRGLRGRFKLRCRVVPMAMYIRTQNVNGVRTEYSVDT